ncbi:MAG: hypothetical protein HYY16_17830 [Planctomycetes bacterium]|nr:hypothetical protein [Planctomycetota bacterium]
MRTTLMACAAAFCFVSLSACATSADEDLVVPEGPSRCDMKLVVKADWCASCERFCGPECPTDAKGACTSCGRATEKRDACVKVYYTCKQCRKDHDEPCKLHSAYACCEKRELLARVACACGGKCPGGLCQKCKERGGCRPRCLH